jgi:hypothetical protein
MKTTEIKIITAADAKKMTEQNKKQRIDFVLKMIGLQAAKGRIQFSIGQTERKPYVFSALKRKGFKIDGNLVKW